MSNGFHAGTGNVSRRTLLETIGDEDRRRAPSATHPLFTAGAFVTLRKPRERSSPIWKRLWEKHGDKRYRIETIRPCGGHHRRLGTCYQLLQVRADDGDILHDGCLSSDEYLSGMWFVPIE